MGKRVIFMRIPGLIYIFGPDGTGKTTQANLLAYYFKRKGIRVWRTSIKYHHGFVYFLYKLLHICGVNTTVLSYYGLSKKTRRCVIYMWRLAEYISVLMATILKVYLPMLLGFNVICDRFVIDTVVTLSYFFKEPDFYRSIFARSLMKLMPKQTLLIFLDANAKIILQRKPDEPLSYSLLHYYKIMYRITAKAYNLRSVELETSEASIRDTFSVVLHVTSKEFISTWRS